MKIHILQTRNGETAPKLIKHIKKCEVGYEYPEDKCFIINYGRVTNKAHLNNNLVHNKLHQLLQLGKKGFNVPEVLKCNPNMVADKHGRRLVKALLPKDIFPIMARKERHFKGKDIIFLKNRKNLWKRLARVSSREFFVKYIPKKAEFRVHVLGDEVPNICKKTQSERTDTHHPHVWCSPRGWTLVDYEGDHYKSLSDIGKRAIKALGYDFGAVDIGLGKDGKFYVFEINSAPRLSRTRRRHYAKYFRMKEKEYRKKLKEERTGIVTTKEQLVFTFGKEAGYAKQKNVSIGSLLN